MNRLLNNWLLKLTALLLSIGIWSHVRGESNPLETATFSVQLDTRARNELVIPSVGLPKTVRVTVRAPHLELRTLGGATLPLANPLTSAADAPPVVNGALTASLDFSNVLQSSGAPQIVPVRAEARGEDVEILGVKPASVSVVLKVAR